MATASAQSSDTTLNISALGNESTDALIMEAPPKLKGRQRLLHSLQRISSSPSLAQLARKRASSNPYVGRSAANSSISLLNSPSGQSPSGSYMSRFTTMTMTSAPTSRIGTPGPSSPSSHARNQSVLPLHQAAGSKELLLPNTPDTEPCSSIGLPRQHSDIPEMVEDYFGSSIINENTRPAVPKKNNFDFWHAMPHEIKLSIFRHLKPKELVRASIVSKSFHRICFDGQLWTCFDASEFYTDIPAESLAKIIVAAGPFVKDLNLRGCVQVEHYNRADVVVKSCKNLINATLEGCRNFQRSTLHTLLTSNNRLAHLNLAGLVAVNNGSCKIISKSCPQLEYFNVSWCSHMDSRGIRMVVAGCPKLKDLRAGEVRGFAGTAGIDVATTIFQTNSLERLGLSGCTDISDDVLKIIIHGIDPDMDILEDRPLVPHRKLRHLDLSRCNRLTDAGLRSLAHNVPFLEGLQLSGCALLTDDALASLLPTTPAITHLDLEELSELTNNLLSEHLAKAPCAARLQHLSISYCEALGDSGMLPIVRACTNLHSIDMDNTRISDLVLAEAASMVRTRSARTSLSTLRPVVSLRLVIFDCQNVTWMGVREILSRNAEVRKPSPASAELAPTFPKEVIGLKCFYGWQMTVDEHMKRVLKGDLPAAGRLERRWTEYMMATEEVGAGGANARRRRRRAREAAALHADEEEGLGMGGVGRRRRARSGGCAIM
jgi:F-box/leucine-rich repeat protein 2/20